MNKINTVSDLISYIFFDNKKLLVFYISCALLLFYSLALILPKEYKITMKFMESQMVQSTSSSQGILSSALGSVGLGSDGQSLNMDKFFEMLHSQRLSEILLEDPIVKEYFFPGEYDEVNDKWMRPKKLIKKIRISFRTILGKPWKEPTAYRLSQELKQEIKIGLTLSTKVNSLSIYSSDKEMGTYILNTVFKQADEIIRQTDAIQYQKYNEYLLDSYDNDFMYQLLTRNEQRLMQINSGSTYIVEEVVSPYAEDYTSKPNYFSLLILTQIMFFSVYVFQILVKYLISIRKY